MSIARWYAAIAACANLAAVDALAQCYPVNAIRVLAGFTAGSAPKRSVLH